MRKSGVLYPEFNIPEVMKQYAERLVIRKADPGRVFQDIGQTITENVVLLKTLPSDTWEIMANNQVERTHSTIRPSGAMVITALIIGSSLVFQTGVGPRVFDYPLAGLFGCVMTMILDLWLLIGMMRSGQL